MTSATPFLMFQHAKGQAAIDFYVATIPGSSVDSIQLFGPEGPGPEGTVLRAYVTIAGQKVMVHDSFVTHGFDFTPSFSFFVDVADEAEFDRLFAALSAGGAVLMPPANYGWSPKFGWCSDRFGVSWQVNLA
ncbi:VOC family protein [Sphingomonas sp. LB-2]|uniref:VOC family protein n=1 Tax=Sphingomonas caeni TaxID=2984949 RepID=UPI002232AAFF|nr:VOC family protein [Sphingomonas caeni]MCW3846994.1 VOC family protein [Sphingomonas caeni]